MTWQQHCLIASRPSLSCHRERRTEQSHTHSLLETTNHRPYSYTQWTHLLVTAADARSRRHQRRLWRAARLDLDIAQVQHPARASAQQVMIPCTGPKAKRDAACQAAR